MWIHISSGIGVTSVMSFVVPTWSPGISKGLSRREHTHTHRSPRSSVHIGDMLALMRADSSPPTHRQAQTGWRGASSSYGVWCTRMCVSALPASSVLLGVRLNVTNKQARANGTGWMDTERNKCIHPSFYLCFTTLEGREAVILNLLTYNVYWSTFVLELLYYRSENGYLFEISYS